MNQMSTAFRLAPPAHGGGCSVAPGALTLFNAGGFAGTRKIRAFNPGSGVPVT